MKPTNLLASFFLLVALAAPGQQPKPKHPSKPAASSSAPTNSAQAIHQSALIIDTHADTPQRFLDGHFDLAQNTSVADGHMDFGKIKQGNLGAEFFSIWVEPDFKGHYAKRTLHL